MEIKILNEVKKVVEQRVGTTVETAIIRNSLFFVTASLIGIFRRKTIFSDGSNEKYINFFGTTLAHQGMGKDTSLDVCEEMFKLPLESGLIEIKKDFNNMNSPLPNGDNSNQEQNYVVPTSWMVSLRGSVEGMMRTANYYDKANIGSLNVVSTEFGSDFNKEVLPLLMKLWQSASAEGSTNVNEMYPNINDVPTNILLFGSPVPFRRNAKKHNELVDSISSGLGRRTLFVWQDYEQIGKSTNDGDMEILKEYGKQVAAHIFNNKQFIYTKEAEKIIDDYRDELLDQYNENPNEINNIRLRSIDRTMRLAALIAIIDLSVTIEPHHVKLAIKYAEESMEAMRKIVAPDAMFKMMFEMLNSTKTWLSSIDFHNEGIVFKNKQEENYEFEKLEKYVHYKNMKLLTRGSQYKVEKLPINNLQRIVVSYNVEGRGPKSINMESMEVPFFGSTGNTIETLVSSDVDYFVFAHFKDSKRNIKNALQGQNCIAFDIDSGMTIKEAEELLGQYIYMIYTTRNHQKDKGGVICDRFRIIMPTKTMFYVDNEQHKEMMLNIATLLNLPSIDVSTRNIDRLWFPMKEQGVVKYTKDKELIDVTCCIPDTEKSEEIVPRFGSLDETNTSSDKRIAGMQRYTLMNTSTGNRNNMLFRLYKFTEEIADKTTAIEITYNTNLMLTEPLSEREIRQLLRS